MGRKCGIKSGENRRRNKRIREAAKVMGKVFLQSEDGMKLLREMPEAISLEYAKRKESGK